MSFTQGCQSATLGWKLANAFSVILTRLLERKLFAQAADHYLKLAWLYDRFVICADE
jgi:hypothetical protein